MGLPANTPFEFYPNRILSTFSLLALARNSFFWIAHDF